MIHVIGIKEPTALFCSISRGEREGERMIHVIGGEG